MSRSVPALSSLLLLAATPPGLETEAPPPPYWTSWNDDDDERSDEPAPPPLQGYHAHGFADPMDMAERPAETCRGDEAAIRKATAGLPAYRVEFWLYATAQQGIMFARSFDWDHKKPCVVKLVYAVERAFVADGLVHSLTVAEEGNLEDPYTRLSREDDGGDSGSFGLLHNLMARKPVKAKGARIEIAGIPVRCRGVSGLAYETVCRSATAGPARGMIVRAVSGDDIREGSRLEVDRLIPEARLSSRLFDLETQWNPRAEDSPEPR